MSLDPGNQFNEVGTSAADFNAQDQVLPNSPVLSNDVNAIAERAYRRTRYLRNSLLAERIVPYNLTLENYVSPFVIGPPNMFTTTTFVDSAVVVDVLTAAAGDDIYVDVWGTWQFNTASVADVIGQLRVNVVEDFGGTPTSTPVGGIAVITSDNDTANLPHERHYAIRVRHRIVNPGTARVSLQGRIFDTSGGAGTGTIILLFGARLDATHVLRS